MNWLDLSLTLLRAWLVLNAVCVLLFVGWVVWTLARDPFYAWLRRRGRNHLQVSRRKLRRLIRTR